MFNISNSDDFCFKGKDLDLIEIERKVQRYSKRKHIKISKLRQDSEDPERHCFNFHYDDDDDERDLINEELKKLIGIRY